MRSIILSSAFAAGAVAGGVLPSPLPNFLQQAEQGMAAMQSTWYSEGSGVWSSTGWWNSANCMTVVANLAIVDPTNFGQTASNVFYHTWVSGPGNKRKMKKRSALEEGGPETIYGPVERIEKRDNTRIEWSHWINDFYDDNGWWALAWIAAYDASNDIDYLTMAQAIFDNNLVNGGPTPCSSNGGGIYWSKGTPYVNAIANELYFSVAAHLAVRSTPDKAPGYLQKAQAQLAWFNNSGMINAQGTINDGLDNNCHNNNGPVFTYNQGVIIGGLVELNKAAPNAAYLQQAGSIANATLVALSDANGIVHDSCDEQNQCTKDTTQFKGIFFRNLMSLQKAAPCPLYQTAIELNAVSIWNNDRTADPHFGVNYAGPNTFDVDASTTSSALDCLVAAAAIQAPAAQ